MILQESHFWFLESCPFLFVLQLGQIFCSLNPISSDSGMYNFYQNFNIQLYLPIAQSETENLFPQ